METQREKLNDCNLYKLLVISLVCSILSVLLCIISIGNFDSYTLDAIDEMQSNINTDDVSGYANLMKVSLSMFLDVGGILGYFIFVNSAISFIN